jgi:uncharacterized protein
VVDIHSAAPGVYRQDVFPTPAPAFLTGVPAFLGYAGAGSHEPGVPQLLTLWPQFAERFPPPEGGGYLGAAVRGFFENEGLLCHVLALEDTGSPRRDLQRGLDALRRLDEVDLVCAPDVMRTADPTADPDVATVVALQRAVLDHCAARGDRFAVLDGVPQGVLDQRAELAGDHGALYHPWVWTPGEAGGPPVCVPPSGHVAGSYSRSDRAVGVHKAPANDELDGVLDLRVNLGDREIGDLYDQGVNCLRALPGRGVRVWGARTLSRDPAWRHVNVRRVVLTLGRWVEKFMSGLVHEPNDVRLWVRIMRDLTAHLEGLHRQGALRGQTPDQAFFVKCDSETNPPEVVDAGMVVTQIGVAPLAPAEFVVVRIIHGASGVAITTT